MARASNRSPPPAPRGWQSRGPRSNHIDEFRHRQEHTQQQPRRRSTDNVTFDVAQSGDRLQQKDEQTEQGPRHLHEHAGTDLNRLGGQANDGCDQQCACEFTELICVQGDDDGGHAPESAKDGDQAKCDQEQPVVLLEKAYLVLEGTELLKAFGSQRAGQYMLDVENHVVLLDEAADSFGAKFPELIVGDGHDDRIIRALGD